MTFDCERACIGVPTMIAGIVGTASHYSLVEAAMVRHSDVQRIKKHLEEG